MMNTEVFPIRISVLSDPFDPVRSGHLDACRAALSAGRADMVLLALSGDPDSCAAPAEERWRMLVTACAGSRLLLPVRLPAKREASGSESILRYLKKKYPGEQLSLLKAGAAGTPLCPSVQEYCVLKSLYREVPRLSRASSWVDRLYKALNPHRFAHSLSVARTSVQLALRYGIDVVLAEEAGLLHDCAKCLSLDEMRKIARKHQLTDDPEFLASASLLHSVVGACVAREDYGMEDPEVLEAIAYHNTGCAGMSRLAMCVCLADFIEPNRTPFPGLAEVRRLSEVSLERALLLSLESVADHVRSGGRSLHPRTLGAIEWLRTLPAVQSAPAESGAVNKEKES